MQRARHILKTIFGYDDFMSIQAKVIQHVLDGCDTLAVMPTGGGKSLCYQIPALLFEGLTVVVSPLISLMNDQIQQLHQYGVPAVMLNSMLDPVEYRRNMEQIQNRQAKLLYVAPETLTKPSLLDFLASLKVDCLAVDEVHCISEWGHDFRPEYRRLAEVRQRFGHAVCLALTATATQKVREDIKACLGLGQGAECMAGFDRPNLFLQVAYKDNAYRQALSMIRRHAAEAGIVYCATRSQVDQLTRALAGDGIAALPYHAGLPDEERHRNQERFSKDDVQVMVATVAFGMGIDKSNIRFVIHFDLPKNIESYYQEIGRAGRDGTEARCLLLYSYGDIHKVKYLIGRMSPSRQRTAHLLLTAMLRFVESEVCRRQVLLGYFGENYAAANCGMCDNCLAHGKETEDLSVPAQKLLACVKRSGETFGVEHVIDVLRGSQAQKILRLGHHKLSTYGIGLEYTKKQWRQLARQLLHKGFMNQDMEYGSLCLTPKAWDLFKGRCAFHGVLDAETSLPEKAAHAAPEAPSAAVDSALFETLRQKRKELADEAKVPPFVIFSDKTLMEMATWFPRTEEEFLEIHGIGQVKAQEYGAVFLEFIRRFCAENGIAPRRRPTGSDRGALRATAGTRIGLKRRYVEIGEAYNAGQSISNLMVQYGVKRATVVSHLFNYWRDRHPIRCDGLLEEITLSAEIQKKVLAAFQSQGSEALGPVYRALNETVTYDDLHILRLYYVNAGQSAEPEESSV